MSYPSIDPGKEGAQFFTVVSGMPWPEIKEGDLREVRDAYERLAEELPRLKELIATVAVKARQEFEGEAAKSFSIAMNEFIGVGGGSDYVGSAADVAKQLADCAGDVANSVEYTKWMAIAQLVQLMFEIAMATLWAPFTFGESFAGLSLKYFFTRQALSMLLKFLLKSILMHSFSGIVTAMLMDSIIQGIQFSHGDRHSYDMDSFKQGVLNGFVGGVLAGPINLLGMGLGKLIGSLIGKSAGSVLSEELSSLMKNGDKEALKHLLNTVTKKAEGSALKDLEKAGATSIGKAGGEALEGAGKSGAKTIGKAGGEALEGVGKSGARTGGKLLSDEESKAFAKSLGQQMQSVEPWLKEGFGKAGAGSVAERFSENLAGTFEKHLGSALGKDAAKKLGQEYAEAFVAGWTKHGAGNESLGVVLRSILEHGGSEIGEHGISALAEHLPNLAAHMGEGSKFFQLGFALGSQLVEGAQGNLSEGFYNLIFDDKHQFTTSAATFGSGLAMGLLGKALHHGFAVTGIGHAWTNLIQSTQFKAIGEGQGAYFPPYHPISILALASNLAGHPAPFPVPRLGPGHEEVTAGHVLGYSRGLNEAPDVEYAALFAKAFGQADLETLFADSAPKPVVTTSTGSGPAAASGKPDPAGPGTGSGKQDPSAGSGTGKADRPTPVRTEGDGGAKSGPGRPPARTDTSWSGTTLVDDPVSPARPGRTVGGGASGGTEEPKHAVATGPVGPDPKPPTPPRTSGATPDQPTGPRPEPGHTGPAHPEPTRPSGFDPAHPDEWLAPWWIKADFPEGALPHWTDTDFTAAAHQILQRPDRSYPDPERPSGALTLHEGEVDGVRLVIGVEDGRVWQIRYLGGADTPRPDHGTPPAHRQDGPTPDAPTPDAPTQRPEPDHGSTDQPQQPSRRRGRDEYENDHGDTGQDTPSGPTTPEPAVKRPRPGQGPTWDGRPPFDPDGNAPRPLRPLDSFLHEFSDGDYGTPGPAARHALEQALAGPDGPKKFAHPQEFVELVNPKDGDGSLLADVNCVAATMAFHAGFHGDPQVALTLSERHVGAVTDAQHWTGYPAEYLGLGTTGLDEVARRVTEGGPGSAAMVFAWTEDGGGHAWNLVNVPGEGLVWVDAQQGLHSPGDRPLPQDVTRVWAITLDPENRPIHGEGGFNAAALHPEEKSARPTPAETFTGADGPSHPAPRTTSHATSHATSHTTEPVTEPAFPSPGERVRVAGDGLCLLNSVATSRPDAVHQVLTERGATRSSALRPAPSTPEAMKRAVLDHLTAQGPDKLPPEVIHTYRKAATRDLADRLGRPDRTQLLDGLLDLGVAGVSTHEVVPAQLLRDRYVTVLTDELTAAGLDPAAARQQAEQSAAWKFKSPAEQAKAEDYLRGLGQEPAADPHALRQQYIDERVARGEDRPTVEAEVGWNLADGATSPRQQFEHLVGKPEQIGLHDLTDAQLADLQIWHLTASDFPLSPKEFAGLRHAVEFWESSWWKGFGETFPPLLADALGLRLRILGPDGHGGFSEYARYGRPDGHQVTVYYNGTDHYDASRPPVPAPPVSTPAPKHPDAHDGPVLPPVPHSVPTVGSTDRPDPVTAAPKTAPKPVADPSSTLTVPVPGVRPKTETGPSPAPKHEPDPAPTTTTGTTGEAAPKADPSPEPAPKPEPAPDPKAPEPAPKPDPTPKPEPATDPKAPERAPHRTDVPSIVITEAEHDPLVHPAPPSPPVSVLAMSVFSTESGGSQDHHDDPAFAPRKPLGPDELRLPPARVTNHRRLSASDLVVGLHGGDTAVHQQIVKLFEAGFPKDLAAANTLAKDFFDPATLRPKLTALSRGDVWEAPFETNGWSGRISVRVDVDSLVHQDTAPSVEFENGSDRHASIGLQSDTLNRFNAGLQAKFKLGRADITETLGYQHDSLKGDTSVEVGRSIARGKTVEPGALFAGKLHLAIDFTELTHHGKPVIAEPGDRVQRLDIGATVGIPVRDTLDAHGAPVPLPKDKLFAPPQRVVEGHRLGGSDIVLDVSTHRHGRPDSDHPIQEVLDGVEETAKEVLGGLWPQLREKMSAELDLSRLQQDLKSMMSGEPTRIEVVDATGLVTGSVEITAAVKAMWQSGSTPQTEFNVGTGVQRVRSVLDSTGDGLQLPLPGVLSGSGTDKSFGSAGGGLQLIKDTVQISGSSQEVLLTTKTKGAGVVYDGRSELILTFERKTPLGTTVDTAKTTVDFRALIEQSEARGVKDTGAGDPTLFVATESPQPHQPKTFEPGSTVPSPPDDVWRRPDGTGGGFGDTSTVRDLPTVKPLHDELDRLGKEVLGGAWKDVKNEVQQLFSHPMVASHLTSMTRQTPLEAPERTAANLLKHGVKVSATAHITELAYQRPNAKAELNPVDETTSFKSGRRLLSDTKSGQGAAGGTVPLPDKNAMETSGGYSRQVRDRDGWRDGSSQKVYANGKYARPQEIYDAGIGVEVKLTVDGKEHTVTVPIRAEVSLDAKETGRYTVGADGRALFTGPGTGTPVTHQGPAEPHDPPHRITERGALSASDVVHSLGNGDTAVIDGVEKTLRKQFGSVPDDVLVKLKNRFDPFALKPQLSKLSRGGKLTEHVSIHGWDTTVTVKAGLTKDFKHTDTVEKFEFELGTQTRVSTGVSKDRRVRDVFSAPFRFKLPHVDLGLNLSRRSDFVHGSTVDTTGATVSKGKTVEPAGLFSGTADFTVHIEARKLGEKVTAPDLTVPVHTTVAVPLRDAPPHGSTETAPLKKPLDPPARVERTHRLGSSDIVTDVYPLRPRGGGGPHPAGGEDHRSVGETAVDGIDRRATKVLGSDWAGMKEKILAELDVTKLQPQLKSMMSGHEIVVKHGRSTVRITAGVSRLEHTGETAQTEFNTGTQVQKSFASSDGVTSYGAGRGNTVTVSAQGTSSPLPVGPAVTAGGSVTHSWGHDQLDVQAQRTTAGAATKTKLAGSVYTGEATLYFRMERRPLVPFGGPDRLVRPDSSTTAPGTAFEHVKSAAGQAWRGMRQLGRVVHSIDTAKVGFEAAIEAGEGRPSKGPKPTPFEAPEHRTAPARPPAPAEPPVETVVKAPPARVWTEGLRDIDVMRWLGDSGGVQDLLRVKGRTFFGSRTWDRLEGLARNTADHTQLASNFGASTRGEPLSTPSPGRRLLVTDGGVQVNLKVLQLEYDRTDGKVELSPSNATSTSSTKTRLDWSLWGGQIQGGVKTDVGVAEGTFQAIVGGSHRTREGLSVGNAGQVVSHAKFNTPMARYDGFAEVEVVFFKGKEKLVEKGVIPITVDIPERETVDAKVMSDHYLTFSENNPDGLATPKHPQPKPDPATAPDPVTPPAGHPKPTADERTEAPPVPDPVGNPEPEPGPHPDPAPPAHPDPAPHAQSGPRLADLIPESSWWRLFIDANVHQDALINSPSDAANHLDRTKYPGFRQSMTELFREVLDGTSGSGRDWSRIDVHAYEELHKLATQHLVEGSGRNVATEWSGTKGDRLHTTMRGTGRTTAASDLADDLVNGRQLLGDITAKPGSTKGLGLPLVAFSRGQKGEGMISISYAHGEAPGHVQAVLDRYYTEVAAATDDHAKLLAIAKVTRALQIIQPFSDANSRVNVSVLMQKFLLEQGFRPSVLTNSFELFLGGYTTHEIADHLVEGMDRFDQYVAGSLGDQFNTAAGPADHTLITQIGDAIGLHAGTGPGDAAVHHHQVLDLVRLGRSLYGTGVPSLDASGVAHLKTARDLSDLAHAMFPGRPTETAVASYADHLYEPGEDGVSWEHLRGTADAIERTTGAGLPLTEADIRAHLPGIEAEGLTDADRKLWHGLADEPQTAPAPTGPAAVKLSWDSVPYESPQDGLDPTPFDVRELSGDGPLDPAGLEEALMPRLLSKDMGSFRIVLRVEDGLLTDPNAAARRVADTFMAPVDLLLAEPDGGVRLTRFNHEGFPYEHTTLQVDHPAGGATPGQHPQPEHPQPEHPVAEPPSNPQPEHAPRPERPGTAEHAPRPEHPGTAEHAPRPERVHEIVDALVHAHEGSDVRWLADPDSPAAQLHETGTAVARFPKDPRFFSVAFHSEHADGAPTWHGERVGPEELANVLAELRARGIWAEGRPLQFPACEFGTGKASSYASEVLTALRGKVSGPLEAYVPEGKLWFVPKPTGAAFTVESDGPGHLVVAKTVGFDSNGLPVVVPGGQWLKVSVPENAAEHAGRPEHAAQPEDLEHSEHPQHPAEPQVEELGPHLPPDLSVPAPHTGLPEGLHWSDSPTVAHEMPGATPFGKRAVYDAPEYATATRDFETKLGAYCHNLPEAEDAARRTVVKLLNVLRQAFPEAPAAERMQTIFKDDPTSAGQIGTQLTPEQIGEFLKPGAKTGNTRELMTAFFNGAYFNDSEFSLKKLLNTIIEKQDWTRAEQLGLNVAALKEHHVFLEGPVRKGLYESLSKVSPKHATMFEHDVFGTGNVLAQSETWFSDGKSYLASLTARRPRPANEVPGPSALQLDVTGVKLSEREVAFLKVNPLAWDVVGLRLEEVLWENVPLKADGSYDLDALKAQPGVHDVIVERGAHGAQVLYKLVEHRADVDLGPGEIGPDTPLSWRTGASVHKLSPDSPWYKEANGGMGMRLVAGISATSAKLMTAFKLLDVAGVDPDHMVKALFGWMLPTSDHSVYEILKGVELTGVTKPLGEDTLTSAENMYRNLPGISLDQVRGHAGTDHMLPHEQVYVSKITQQDGGFREPGGPHRNVVEKRFEIFEEMAAGKPDDDINAPEEVVEGVRNWLNTNHMTPQEVLSKLTKAHFYALAAYTGPVFPLINVMMRFGDSLDRAMLVQIKHLLWGSGPTPLSLASHPAIKDLLRQHSAIESVENANRKKIMELVRTDVLPGLKAELREHTRMLESALEQLPPAEGKVYRGAAAISFKGFTGLSPAYGGSHVKHGDFTSTSRRESVAIRFRDTRRTVFGTEPLLVTMELTGGGAAKDISAFSVEMQEHEVLGKPGSTYTVQERRKAGGKLFIDVKEANSRSSFPPLGTPGTPASATVRQAKEELQSHLAGMSGVRGIKEHGDLWALGKEIGVTNADGLGAWSAAHAFPNVKTKEAMGLKTWYIGNLAAELHGGPNHVDIDRLRSVRRMTDVVREGLKLSHENPVTKEEVDTYLKRLNKVEDASLPVVPLDRHRLLKVVNSLKKQGAHVSASEVEKNWTALQAPGTPRTPRTPGGGHLTPATPNTPNTPDTPQTPTGHQAAQPGGHNPPGDPRRQPVTVIGAAPNLETHVQKQAAMQRFPLDDRFFTVAMHTDSGYPVHVNQLLSPDQVATGLHQAFTDKTWDGEKPLQFVACNLGSGIETSYVAQVMTKLWALDPTITGSAYAGDGPVWFVPKVDENGVPDLGRRGDLVVAHRVGMTKTGRPGISAGGNWYRFDRPTDGTLVPVVEQLGAHLPPGGDSQPRPENYLRVDHDDQYEAPIRGAIPFDTDQPDALAEQIFQELIK